MVFKRGEGGGNHKGKKGRFPKVFAEKGVTPLSFNSFPPKKKKKNLQRKGGVNWEKRGKFNPLESLRWKGENYYVEKLFI